MNGIVLMIIGVFITGIGAAIQFADNEKVIESKVYQIDVYKNIHLDKKELVASKRFEPGKTILQSPWVDAYYIDVKEIKK